MGSIGSSVIVVSHSCQMSGHSVYVLTCMHSVSVAGQVVGSFGQSVSKAGHWVGSTAGHCVSQGGSAQSVGAVEQVVGS